VAGVFEAHRGLEQFLLHPLHLELTPSVKSPVEDSSDPACYCATAKADEGEQLRRDYELVRTKAKKLRPPTSAWRERSAWWLIWERKISKENFPPGGRSTQKSLLILLEVEFFFSFHS